jgi:hypothetical protein
MKVNLLELINKMTKNQLINLTVSLKVELKYLKRDLQFRLEGNDIDKAINKYKDDEHKYAKLAGAFQAMASMDNDTFKRAIKSIENMEKELNN